jgi:hypothetical protein
MAELLQLETSMAAAAMSRLDLNPYRRLHDIRITRIAPADEQCVESGDPGGSIPAIRAACPSLGDRAPRPSDGGSPISKAFYRAPCALRASSTFHPERTLRPCIVVNRSSF